MTDLKISDFADGGTIQETDSVAAVRSGVNTKVVVGTMAAQDATDYGALADANDWADVQTMSGGIVADSIKTSGSSGVVIKNSGGTTVAAMGSANTTNVSFAGAVSIAGALTGNAIKDEDNMASDSATAVPTQQSVKAYVDAQVTTAGKTTTGYATSTLSKTSDTTLALVTGCSVALAAGGKYIVRVNLPTTSGSAGGIKAALVASGGLTATTLQIEGFVNGGVTQQTRAASLGTAFVNITLVAAAHVWAQGYIDVADAGDLQVHFAQSVSNGTASVALLGTWIEVVKVA